MLKIFFEGTPSQQWQALKDDNKYFTEKAIKVEEKSFNLR